MTSHRGDVLIVGAGPAGTAAAFDLARAGKRVLLLDKAEFPRIKPCAGGLTIRAVKTLRYSVADLTQRVCSDFHARYGQRLSIFGAPAPVVHMTVREAFDAFNLEQARRAGAEYHHIGPIRAIYRAGQRWQLQTDEQHFEAEHLIGADGANSRVRQLCGTDERRFACAAEACLPESESPKFAMEMDFAVCQGYGWVFPKGDHLNIGIYSLTDLRGIKTALQRYSRERLGRELDPKTIIGHRIPIGGHRFKPDLDGPLLVGDAAGLADPFFGEGIYNALRSGQLAAAAIIDGTGAAGYARRIREITADLASYWWITRFFYDHPRLGYRLLCLPPIRAALMKGVALGWTTRKTLKRFPVLPFQAVR